MSDPVILIEHLSKSYRLGQIGTGTLSYDLKIWWAKLRGKPNPLLRIGEKDHGNREGEVVWALKDVNLEVHQGEVVGIIGKNGAGKSTLLKILARVTAPAVGQVKVKGRIASLLEVGTGFHPDLTGRENIYLNGAILGMRRDEIKRKFDEIVDFAGISQFIDTPVKRYSSGMYVRLAFAVAAHLESEILLIDEVLAVGDAEFQKKCLGKMGDVAANEGRTVLFVSHNMEAVLNLCPSTCLLEKGKIAFSGRSEEAVNSYLNDIRNLQGNIEPHVLYNKSGEDPSEPIYVKKIELLDSNLHPKSIIYTWDFLNIRIHYYSEKKIKASSIIMDVFDYKQERLAVFDSGLQFSLEKGDHYVDCRIPQVPFSAGEYFLGIGLAIPNAAFLWRRTNLAVFRISGKDVFDLGRPPISTRMIVAIPHEWKANE